MDKVEPDEPGRVACSECGRVVDEFEVIAEKWTYWSDGADLLPYCPVCAEREFGAEDRKARQEAGLPLARCVRALRRSSTAQHRTEPSSQAGALHAVTPPASRHGAKLSGLGPESARTFPPCLARTFQCQPERFVSITKMWHTKSVY